MPWTQHQRMRQYGYYRSRAMDLLRQVEAPHAQPAELVTIIQVATSLSRACPFIALKHFYQLIITQATTTLTDITGAQREAYAADRGHGEASTFWM